MERWFGGGLITWQRSSIRRQWFGTILLGLKRTLSQLVLLVCRCLRGCFRRGNGAVCDGYRAEQPGYNCGGLR